MATRKKQTKAKTSRSGGRGIAAISIGAAAIAAIIGYAAVRLRGPGNAEHEAPDLALD